MMNENNKTTVQTVMVDFCEEIANIVKSNLSPKKMQEQIGAYHKKDIASALTLLGNDEIQRLFRILSTEDIAEILEYSENNDVYFNLLGLRQKSEVIAFMEISSAAQILSKLSKEDRTALLDLINPDTRDEILLVCSFDLDEIGSRISTNYIKIPYDASIKEAMSDLIFQAAENDNISMMYLIDNNKTFCGAVSLNDLIIAREGTPLSDITTYSYPYLYAKTPLEECIPYFKEYSEDTIPVLNDENQLIGVVTAQDFLEIIDDELGEDYAKLAGLAAEEDLSEPISQSVKKRIPWLIILLAMGLAVSATVGMFESIVAQLPIIMCFQSLILDMAGNVGTQSLAVAIRVLMDSKIKPKQKSRLVLKEARIGLLNGFVLGLLSFMAIGAYLCLKGNEIYFSFAVSACLGIAMILTMVISSLSGTVIPIFFKSLGIDPAVASGPLITTVNDLVAVVTYYGLAWLILINMMHF